jgi:hypothetical protein
MAIHLWSRFWFHRQAGAHIAPFRIFIAGIAMAQFAYYAFNGSAWFGPSGWFSPSTSLHYIGDSVDGTGSVYRWSLLFRYPELSNWFAWLGLLSSVLLAMGIGSRLAPLIAWLCLGMFHHRAPFLIQLHEPLLSACLGYLIIDTGSLTWNRWPTFASGPDRTTVNIALRLAQCQLSIWMLAGVVNMLQFPIWLDGRAVGVLLRDGGGYLSLPNSWGIVGYLATYVIILTQLAIVTCLCKRSWLGIGRGMLIAFSASVLLLLGDWMYAGTLMAMSFVIRPNKPDAQARGSLAAFG